MHFAPAQDDDRSPLLRVLRCPQVPGAANDNVTTTRNQPPSDVILRAALRHFAEHGLGAARAARAKAQEAFFAGDRASYDWWLEITRTLDRRLALEAANTSKSAPNG
jgi:hypothetical protein